MKKLFIIRHAKSDWSNPSLDDYDRPLSKRGKKNAPFMGKIIAKKDIVPDLIISSPAYRARETAKIIAEKVSYQEEILYNEYIYEASLKTLLEIINFIDDEYDDVFIFGHNPGLNMLAFYLIDFNENLPTCAVLEIEFDCESWREATKSNAKLISYEYPKKFKQLEK
ncbi:SixA phosphatase family protein [Arcobacter arenosus]|jgi:phosphohistidine phosphatase|uniref:Histidine phosphatase family protein n=1 Tax=Arcobacter arenosus TaxID=2576037 RepID=A0A5R8XZ55_9BACT|nr:histidine phosphatase family protein [Arcobacter arenosus]TLP36877.1 histidine phosphatase family protein [Arcobacter arenosus]